MIVKLRNASQIFVKNRFIYVYVLLEMALYYYRVKMLYILMRYI